MLYHDNDLTLEEMLALITEENRHDYIEYGIAGILNIKMSTAIWMIAVLCI